MEHDGWQAQGEPSTHHSSSTTRTSTKNVFLLTRFLNVSAKGENFSYVERRLKKRLFSHGGTGCSSHLLRLPCAREPESGTATAGGWGGGARGP